MWTWNLSRAGVVTIAGELNLELHLVSFHWDAADRARSADAWPTPCPIRPTTRELSVLDYLAGNLSKDVLVHLAHLGRTTPAARKTRGKPDARGSDA